MALKTDNPLKFGSLTLATVYVLIFAVVFIGVFWLLAYLMQMVTGGLLKPDGDEGGYLFMTYELNVVYAVLLLPIAAVSAISAWLVSTAVSKKTQLKKMPTNKSASLVLSGLILLFPAWLIGLFVWNQQFQTGGKPSIFMRLLVAVLLQIVAVIALGLLGAYTRGTRQTVWRYLVSAVVLFMPTVVLGVGSAT